MTIDPGVDVSLLAGAPIILESVPTPGSRQRRIVVLGWVARIFALGVSLAIVRFALRLLGESQYAVFQILSAALAWLSLASLGVGPALKNLVSEFRARNESDAWLREASGGLLGVLFVLGVLLLVIVGPVTSESLLRKLSHDRAWVYRAFLAGGILSLVATLGQVSMEVLYAEFRAQWVYILSIAASALTLSLMILLSRLDRPSSELLFWVMVVTIGPQAVNGIVALRMTGLLGLNFSMPDMSAFATIMKLALRFWLFALLSNLVLMVDYLVISQILIAREIVLYSIMMKISTVGLVLFSTVIAVVWPEWTHNWELRQWATLRKRVLSLATLSVAVCIPGALIAVVALPLVIRIWLPEANVLPSEVLVLEFVVYLAIRFWTDVHSAALMSGSRVFAATAVAACQALITAPLEYVFGRLWGVEGVIFGLLIGFVATAAWMFPRRFYSELRSLSASDSLRICERSS